MQSISILRQTIQNLALRGLGANRSSSRLYAGQRFGDLFTNQIMQLPAVTNIPAIQDLNPSSPNYGKFYFMAGYSATGGGDPISP